MFVAMWLDEEMEKAYTDGIKPAIEKAGYKPFMITEEEFIDKIDERIMAELRRSRFVVADFTHGSDGARGSVYYEAGFAHGLGKPVVYICHKSLVDRLHFDTRQYNHVIGSCPVLGQWRCKLKLSQGRVERIHRVLCYYKLVVAYLTALIGVVAVHSRDLAGEDYGVKAAVLALLAAGVWFAGLIPPDHEKVEWWFSKLGARSPSLAAGVLTVLAGWNWLADETNGDVVGVLWSALGFLVAMLVVFTFSTIVTILSPSNVAQRDREEL